MSAVRDVPRHVTSSGRNCSSSAADLCPPRPVFLIFMLTP
jgi:hypothetical protein